MHTSSLYLHLLVLASAPFSVLARPSSCGAPPKNNTNGKAIYFLTNDKSNAVVALPIGQDGLLRAPGTKTATGGSGGNGVTAPDNKPAAPDALFSQGSLTVAGNKLFAVNPGSNTLSMFSIDHRDPTKLVMLGKPISVLGEFPTTVAASKKHKIVCVGSTGAKAGVACSSFSSRGLEPMDNLRAFDIQQTTPPLGPTNTVSQVFFSEDESKLFSTVKGDPTKNNTGFLAAFDVEQSKGSAACVSQQGSLSSPNGTAVLFGSSAIPGSSDLVVTDASFGAAILSIDQDDKASVKGKGVVSGQKATCWVAVSPATNSAFVTDVATNRLVQVSLDDASIQNEIDLSANGDPGLIDLRAAGDFVYALSPGNGTTSPAITVVNAVSKQQVQHLQLQSLGVDANAQGMAVLD